MARAVCPVAGTGVSDVEHRLVGRKRQSIGLFKVIRYTFNHAAVRVYAVDVAGTNVAGAAAAFVLAQDAIVRVTEPDRAVRMHHHIIGRVQALALPAIGQHGARAIVFGTHHAAAQVLATDQSALPVHCIAVGIVGGLAVLAHRIIALIPAQHPVIGNVGPDQRGVGRKPSRAFAPACPSPQLLHTFVRKDAGEKACIVYFKR